MTTKGRRSDPIKKVPLADGRIRYRFVIDMGKKPDGKRDQRTITCDSLGEARAERARIMSERARGILVKPSKMTVAAVVADWLESIEVKPSTHRGYVDALKPFTDLSGERTTALGHLAVQALDVPHLDRLKREMLSGQARRIGAAGKPLSARTVNYSLGAISTVLRWAEARRLVHHNVGKLVQRVKGDQDAGADRGGWETNDAKAFLAHVADDRLYAAWLLSMCGLRRGEVLGLRWPDIDLTGERAEALKFPAGTPTVTVAQNRVEVAGKVITGSPKARASRRTLPLMPAMVKALKALKATQAAERLALGGGGYNPDGLVVVHEDGTAVRPEHYSDLFVYRGRAAGLPRIPLHGARHAAASILGDLGMPDVAVAAWLGQAQVKVTHGYQHAQRDRLVEAAKLLGEAFAG